MKQQYPQHTQNHNDRLNVLVCAYACSPLYGSEEGVGWNIVSRLGAYHNITVLYGDCGGSNKRTSDLQRWFIDNGPVDAVEFCYVAPSRIGKFLLSVAHYGMKLFPPLVFIYYLSYRSWLREAYKKAVQLHAEHPFDITHQLTYISYREPGFLWKLPVPFVWGPIAGAVNVPWKFFGCFSPAGMLRLAFRNVFNHLQIRGNRYICQAVRKSSLIWAVGEDELRMATGRWHANAELMPETGTSPSGANLRNRAYDYNARLSLLWSGTHEGAKALPLLLRALAQIKEKHRVRLTVLGDGPEHKIWRRLAERLQIHDMLSWTGLLSHVDAKLHMLSADIFVFTSLKEATSTVVMEALAGGLPVICHDACGMAEVIDETCGIKIPMESPRKSVDGFRDAIQFFLDNPSRIQTLSKGACARATSLSWDSKVERIAGTYRRVTHQAGFKPLLPLKH